MSDDFPTGIVVGRSGFTAPALALAEEHRHVRLLGGSELKLTAGMSVRGVLGPGRSQVARYRMCIVFAHKFGNAGLRGVVVVDKHSDARSCSANRRLIGLACGTYDCDS